MDYFFPSALFIYFLRYYIDKELFFNIHLKVDELFGIPHNGVIYEGCMHLYSEDW